MDCAACKEPMVVLELNEIEIDYCISCGGIWLDAGELELLLEGSAKKDSLLASFKSDGRTKERPRKCPICLKTMEKVSCGADKRALLDRCRRNDGIWFDKGELEEVIRMGCLDEDNRILGLLKDMFGKGDAPKGGQK